MDIKAEPVENSDEFALQNITIKTEIVDLDYAPNKKDYMHTVLVKEEPRNDYDNMESDLVSEASTALENQRVSSQRHVNTITVKCGSGNTYSKEDSNRSSDTTLQSIVIKEELILDVAQCKKRWKNLRSVFVRNLKPLPGGSGAQKKKPYYLMSAMNFAMPFVKTKIVPPVIAELSIPQTELDRDDQDNSKQNELDNSKQNELSYPPSRVTPQPPRPNSPQAASKPPTQQPHTSAKVTKKLKPKRSLTISDVDRSFIEYVAAKKARLAISEEAVRKNCAIKSFLSSLLPELEPMTEDQLRQFRRKVFVLIDSIYQSPPNHDCNSSSASSLHSPMPASPTYTRLQMEPSSSSQYTDEVSNDGTTSCAQNCTDQGSIPTCATLFLQIDEFESGTQVKQESEPARNEKIIDKKGKLKPTNHEKGHSKPSQQKNEKLLTKSIDNCNEANKKSYQCDFCSKSFSKSSNLNDHYRTHTGEKPYKCDKCPKTFTSSSNMTKHHQTHTGEKPYKCDLCTRSFTKLSNLNEHCRTHTGEKPFPCNFCQKLFKHLSSFNNHVRTHTGERPYVCDMCPKSFIQKSNMTKHLKKHAREIV